MMILDSIKSPTLLLDPARTRHNMMRIIQKTRNQGLLLRPHFKTHQSLEIGSWFREEGIDRITVSSVGMAYYFLQDGWKDITIAFPVNVRQMEDILNLSRQVTLGLVVVHADAIESLGKQVKNKVNLWIKIDVGTHRTGVRPDDLDALDGMIACIGRYQSLHFAGFIGHAGHSYQSRSKDQVQESFSQSVAILSGLKSRYVSKHPEMLLSVGDTPAVSMLDDLRGVDEWRPGNFIFYDLMQAEIGSCTMDNISVAMACPVVAVHPERQQWIIYGGGIHFSKDFLTLPDGRKYFGRMVTWKDGTWDADRVYDNPFLISLSQEHGVVQCTEQNFHLCKPGDITLWLPVHSCLTADVMGEYLTVDGNAIDHYRKRIHP
jgi:D-serine deaminase-like pyridoxal phosphate-dependent protein